MLITNNSYAVNLHKYEKNNILKLISLKKIKKENPEIVKIFYNNKLSKDRYKITKDNKSSKILKQKELYYLKFRNLRQKIYNYINDELSINSLIPLDTEIFVNVYENNILASYPSTLFYELDKIKYFLKYGSDSNFFNYQKLTTYLKYYAPLIRNKKSVRFLRLSRRRRLGILLKIYNYKMLTNNSLIAKRNYLQDNNLEKNSIVLGFLNQNDANLYKHKVLNENRQPGLFYNHRNYRRLVRFTKALMHNKCIQVKPTTIRNIYESLENYYDIHLNQRNHIFILIPEFFRYKESGEKILISTLNFPSKMLTKEGFKGIPVYKTKPIIKKYIPKNTEAFNDLLKRKNYIKTENLFLTFDKEEYQSLSKDDKKELIFYKKEKDYTDTLTNVVYETKQKLLNNTIDFLNKVKKKCKTIKNLNLVNNYIVENYNKKNLLEKISYYIDTIEKKTK